MVVIGLIGCLPRSAVINCRESLGLTTWAFLFLMLLKKGDNDFNSIWRNT